jgi:hypothetical protein
VDEAPLSEAQRAMPAPLSMIATSLVIGSSQHAFAKFGASAMS